MSSVILSTKNLNYLYSKGTSSQIHAIRDINVQIEKGELVGIIGHTGSGKSTLIQHFNGLLKGTSGVVELEGKDIWADKRARPHKTALKSENKNVCFSRIEFRKEEEHKGRRPPGPADLTAERPHCTKKRNCFCM